MLSILKLVTNRTLSIYKNLVFFFRCPKRSWKLHPLYPLKSLQTSQPQLITVWLHRRYHRQHPATTMNTAPNHHCVPTLAVRPRQRRRSLFHRQLNRWTLIKQSVRKGKSTCRWRLKERKRRQKHWQLLQELLSYAGYLSLWWRWWCLFVATVLIKIYSASFCGWDILTQL